MPKIATLEVIEDLQDLHNGLQLAMDKLIRDKDYTEAEVILRQVDARMSQLINTTTEQR